MTILCIIIFDFGIFGIALTSNYNILNMNIIKATTRLVARTTTFRPIVSFSDAWKERDDAAEKVYITRKESNPVYNLGDAMKKLLERVEAEAADNETNAEEF